MTAVLPEWSEVPARVQQRVLRLAAQVLPDVPDLPGSLRSIAAFAPARRARLGAAALRAALEDGDFRQRVATQVSALPLSDDQDRLAASWLAEDEGGWTDTGPEPVTGPDTGLVAQVESLTTRLRATEEALREQKAKHREALDQLKADNADLRRKLGQARTALAQARTQAEQAEADLAAAQEERARAEAAADADLRRLRGQLREAQQSHSDLRQADRARRDDATVRARLLLDTVSEAVKGLQRELGLPVSTARPADRLEEDLTAGATTRLTTAAGSMGPTSGALLEQVLALPRVRLVIDGYNVSKHAWGSASLAQQRSRLLGALPGLVGRTKADTTVVFDAADVADRPPVNPPRGVRVVFSPHGVIADDVIRDLVGAEPEGRVVAVVTDDRALEQDLTRLGARVFRASALLDRLA